LSPSATAPHPSGTAILSPADIRKSQ
jgi:hypothetical protein